MDAVLEAITPTADEIRADIVTAVQSYFHMTVPQFVQAWDHKTLQRTGPHDRAWEIMSWLRVLPADDPIFR